MSGTVPADSMSQLVNVFFPNCVDFAVKRRRLRFYTHGLCHKPAENRFLGARAPSMELT